ncbi:MAG: S-formylglutathione hydrolase [Bdellovibrionota bacterium]
MEKTKSYKQFGGYTNYYSHESKITGTKMNFAAYLPPQAGPAPVLYWLSGLTCTEENFITKAYAQLFAARTGFVVVAPDTSPRGANIPGEDDSYDLGTGAGFYVDATQAPWAKNYKMYSYITEELRELVEKNLPVDPSRSAISGHSMGGHGALTMALSLPHNYRAASAFSPIVAPSQVPWGIKALGGFLGANKEAWRKHDAVALIEDGARFSEFLVDIGDADPFLNEQLRPELLERACAKAGIPLNLRRQNGYDHSYYFVSTLMADHMRWHAARLKA